MSWLFNLILYLAQEMNSANCITCIVILCFIGMFFNKPFLFPLIAYFCSWGVLLINWLFSIIGSIHGWEWLGVIIVLLILWTIFCKIRSKIIARRTYKENFIIGAHRYEGTKKATITRAQRREGFEAARKADEEKNNKNL